MILRRSTKVIKEQLEKVKNLIDSYQPRLTDCTTIVQREHCFCLIHRFIDSDKAYVNRMIAVDEISREIGWITFV